MDLTTRYMGLRLENPLIASASPLSGELANIRRMEDHGVGAVVLPSIFEEQIRGEERRFESLLSVGVECSAEAHDYFPAASAYRVGPDRYLTLIRRAVQAVSIPVIASLNGVSDEGWIDYATAIEEAGARAIEINVYFIPTDPEMTGAEVERRYLDIVRAVKRAVSIPVAVKLNPYFSACAHMAAQLDEAGADALVLFNRFYQPDIDLVRMSLVTDLELSQPYEIRLPLLWIGILHGRVRASLAATTGVEGADEIVKYLLVGADAVMATSTLLRHGVGHVSTLLAGLRSWLESREIESVDAIRGAMSRHRAANPMAFERANYVRILQDYAVPGGKG